MNSDFQKYIIGEVEEVGDIALKLLIPNFLLFEKKQKVTSPLMDNLTNYDIKPDDFSELKRQLCEILADKNYSLFKYIGANRTWEESYLQLTRKEEEEVLDNKQMWLNNADSPSFFIADRW